MATPLSESGLTHPNRPRSTKRSACSSIVGYTPATAGSTPEQQAKELKRDVHHAVPRILKSAAIQ